MLEHVWSAGANGLPGPCAPQPAGGVHDAAAVGACIGASIPVNDVGAEGPAEAAQPGAPGVKHDWSSGVARQGTWLSLATMR